MLKYKFFAQPIENIRSNKIVMFELLLRQWDADQERWMRPTSFELAPELMVTLLEQSLCKLGQETKVSINLTEAQFSDQQMVAALAAFVQQNMLPRQLTVELIFTPQIEVLKRISVEYRKAGILLAIDDVGSDNLYHDLKEVLPYFSTAKFALQNMRLFGKQTSRNIVDILRVWFNVSEEQQMLFTFEGIENIDDLELAISLGISRGQGYFYAKPQTPQFFCEDNTTNQQYKRYRRPELPADKS